MHIENLLAFFDRGQNDLDLSIKAARSQKGVVQAIGTIRRRQHDHRAIRAKAIHLNQKLVERVVSLLVAAAHSAGSLLTDSVNLVNEDDCWGFLSRRLKHIAHSRGTHTDEHLDKLRSTRCQEWDTCLSSHSLGKQRLATARGSAKQGTSGYSGAKCLVFLWMLQEVDKLNDFLLGIFIASHIFEPDVNLFVLTVDSNL